MSPSASRSPRAAVVYESLFGNTARVARAVAAGMRAGGYDVRCVDVAGGSLGVPQEIDVLVVGAPTHAFSLSRPGTRADAVRQGAPAIRAASGLREWLEAAEPAGGGEPVVAVFDTRVRKVRHLPAAAGPAAARIARRRGFRPLGRPMAFLVTDTDGPLCEGELERAEEWGRTLGRSVPVSR